MVRERERAGLSGPGPVNVELTSDGFVFGGEPVRPRRHWEALLADLTPQQLQAAKKLGRDQSEAPLSSGAQALAEISDGRLESSVE